VLGVELIFICVIVYRDFWIFDTAMEKLAASCSFLSQVLAFHHMRSYETSLFGTNRRFVNKLEKHAGFNTPSCSLELLLLLASCFGVLFGCLRRGHAVGDT
jgi:hypothetical protein